MADWEEDLGASHWQERRDAIQRLDTTSASVIPRLVALVRREHAHLGSLNSALDLLTRSEEGVQGLLELLGDDVGEVRAYAAQALGLTASSVPVAALRLALQDPAPNVASLAIESLGRLGAREAVPDLLALVASADFFTAFPAIEALGQLGDTRAVPALLARLPDEVVGETVVLALGRIGDGQAKEPILRWMQNGGDPSIALGALTQLQEPDDRLRATVLGRLTSEQATRALSRFALDYSSTAAHAVGWLATSPWPSVQTESVRLLVNFLADPACRESAGQALQALGGQAVPALLEGIEMVTDDARYEIIILLGQIGDARALPALQEVLESGDAYAVALGLASWAQLAASDGRPFLDRLGHASSLVRQVAIAGLVARLDNALTADLRNRLPGAPPLERDSLIRVLGEREDARSAVFAALQDEAPTVRRTAVEMLARWVGDDAYAAAQIGELLESGLPSLRAAAARALADAKPAFAVPLLLNALSDSDSWTRLQACKSLGKLGQVDAVEYICRLHDDPAPYVRAVVAETLGVLGGDRAVDTLAQLLLDSSSDVQLVAMTALGQTHHPHAIPPLLQCLASDDANTRVTSAAALAVHGAPQAIDALEKLTGSHR